MADKVQELAKYKSEFFGRLRDDSFSLLDLLRLLDGGFRLALLILLLGQREGGRVLLRLTDGSLGRLD